MKFIAILLTMMLDISPAGQAFLKPLQQRDSILIADQLEYGFQLDDVTAGTTLGLQDFSKASNDTLVLVRGWQLDTLYQGKGGKGMRKAFQDGKPVSVRASIVIAPFEEGEYQLPDIYVRRLSNDQVDTLLFSSLKMDVKTMPVDTATFQLHDIKGQMTYPITFAEVWPWVLGALVLAALIVLAVYLLKRRKSRMEAIQHKDPPHIVALRELDKFRSDKYWAPEKQKAFYSGITDALKVYIDVRFGVDAPEMTTAELFKALKSDKDITPEMWSEMKDLFERADFVKFAKFVADDSDNARALPTAVRFVTSTYESEIDQQQGGAE